MTTWIVNPLRFQAPPISPMAFCTSRTSRGKALEAFATQGPKVNRLSAAALRPEACDVWRPVAMGGMVGVFTTQTWSPFFEKYEEI